LQAARDCRFEKKRVLSTNNEQNYPVTLQRARTKTAIGAVLSNRRVVDVRDRIANLKGFGSNMSKIGFIGLGVMGTPMARNLIAGGHELYVHSKDGIPSPLNNIPLVKACDSNEAVARSADIIIVMVPDTPDVEAVLFGKNGVASGLSHGKLVIDMSSISPLATRGFAEAVAKLGCEYLDAPVSGGEVGAKAASLTIMVGGDAAAFERAKPLFDLMGKNINLIGGHGAGQICKAANQMIVALNLAAVSEALVLATSAGVDPKAVRNALLGGFASSRVLEVHGERMVERKFEPGFRIDLHRKDLAIALDTAQGLGVALPQTAGVAQLMSTAKALGLGGNDHSAIVLALESLSQRTLD
jgi:2-hydroxy-3-oxopropionate reductase